ncbi:Lysine--tRNA ligase [Frankia sp. AiPs1]|uniref:lysine--tRNA ligase n=1 Tax=Frankia sp. AiPa1 TaxID=573492 RepID=UPI00202B488D|nr:lysine--tRNA ligase [Frankia sp. AiPa1]MCL9758124.1 lysine--tRNA ligase [Frankia sp. AiPa1]
MLWNDRLVQDLTGRQVVNDSKTPSGPVHVGALRGALIHDAVYRSLTQRGLPARYLFGVDDYDPLDELPAAGGEHFRQYLGMPLCNVPAPPGSDADSIAAYYIRDFFEVFRQLHIDAETYRMRDIYRSGEFDSEIDIILRHADTVRRVDREVAHARRPDDWYPFQVICEACGKIGTTRVSHYDGQLVTYSCEPSLVKWAEGCGNRNQISPFGGNGKLSWKLEWVAKWHHFPVTIEGAGKDHNAPGGSRNVAVRCLQEIFGDTPPRNIPYEFFLVGGAKMSSSRGVGVTVRDMARLLPPEMLRFLMLRTQPNKTVDFQPDVARLTRLYSDFDRVRAQTATGAMGGGLYQLAALDDEPAYYAPPFDLVASLIQLPHLDIEQEIARLKGDPLTAREARKTADRIAGARYWLKRFATPEERLELKSELPLQAAGLSTVQIAFLHHAAKALQATLWEADLIQAELFNAARLTPLAQRDAFEAIYVVLFGALSGPRAGNLLAFLDRRFVLGRLTEAPFDEDAFWREASLDDASAARWLEGLAPQARDVSANLVFLTSDSHAPVSSSPGSPVAGGVELTVVHEDGKAYRQRVDFAAIEVSQANPTAYDRGQYARHALAYIAALEDRIGREITKTGAPM